MWYVRQRAGGRGVRETNICDERDVRCDGQLGQPEGWTLGALAKRPNCLEVVGVEKRFVPLNSGSVVAGALASGRGERARRGCWSSDPISCGRRPKGGAEIVSWQGPTMVVVLYEPRERRMGTGVSKRGTEHRSDRCKLRCRCLLETRIWRWGSGC